MYGSLDDMIVKFGKIETTRLSVADGVIPDKPSPERIAEALAHASSTIDSYLRKHYVTPIVAPPPAIVGAACIIARYRLAGGGDRTPSKEAKDAYDETVAWLKLIAEGKASIAAPELTGGGNESSGAFTSDRDPMFSDDSLRGW